MLIKKFKLYPSYKKNNYWQNVVINTGIIPKVVLFIEKKTRKS